VRAADPSNPSALKQGLADVVGDLTNFVGAVNGAPEAVLPRTQEQQLAGIAQRLQDQLGDDGRREVAVQTLKTFAKGRTPRSVVTARVDWSTQLDPSPSDGSGAIFRPLDPQTHQPAKGKITLAVEIQAPTQPGTDPSVLASCSLTPFDLR